jgi:2-polyprenyl-3-methyl-5-hydroxy-6-metoxy-1,4-benzoquinol methylase
MSASALDASAHIAKAVQCHLCGSFSLRVANDYSRFTRVTSDCKPWRAGGALAGCNRCGLVQTPTSNTWRAEADKIYRHYAIYHQSNGLEQSVYTGRTNTSGPRSDAIVDGLLNNYALPECGRLLDVGCGNGSFLRAFARRLAHWSLYGTEVSEKYRGVVESIQGVQRLYVSDLTNVDGAFDLISFIHVLEHIPSPQMVLQAAMEKLTPKGLLLIEVPDCLQNPFMLMVADHCSHFSLRGLAAIVTQSRFQVLHGTTEWVSKEVSIVARKRSEAAPERPFRLPPNESEQIIGGVGWLGRVVDSVRHDVGAAGFSVFGTAIAATWLDDELGRAAEFFVDEDPNRIGKVHMGRRILSPAELPTPSTLVIALPRPLADNVANRIARSSLRLVLPPAV